ncbi:YEATS domain-containing protein 4 [Alligator sinensis]|uniref:YEATS domain-containing protein 4 n=1 Tax=Alligator sinensis TaxID=38654 RepID=A0A3Q0H051_ALLSI|nr:YEATS domain-containing protein 4 [Alligator sinensis]
MASKEGFCFDGTEQLFRLEIKFYTKHCSLEPSKLKAKRNGAVLYSPIGGRGGGVGEWALCFAAAATATASHRRQPGLKHRWGVTIVKPIVYGNVARYFGKKREEDGHTHQWTVYVKPYRNEDMSAYVKKIQFKLHESYGNPLRVVTKPPYEITETGWGEFEIIIKIFFIDPNERPVTLYHLLKLFQSDTNAILGKKTVVSEFYDEMIFQDPTAMMQQLLTTSRQLTLGAYKHETEFADLEVKTREKLEAAKKKTSFEIAELKERLKASRETINCLKNEIRKLEEDDQSKDI